MINKIQYLRKLTPIGQSAGYNTVYNTITQPDNTGVSSNAGSTYGGAVGGAVGGSGSAASGSSTNGSTTQTTTQTSGMGSMSPVTTTTQTTTWVTRGGVPGTSPTHTPNILYPTPNNLIFHSIDDLTTVSNQPLVHSRDLAGNIILINDTSSNNQLLTIESVSYTVPNTILNNVINTQFNYFKFPPRLSNIEVADEIKLTDAIEAIDTISTRYTPSLTSGRQTGVGREPVLRAGMMIAEGVDDTNVSAEPWGYYNRDNNSYSILNMETVLAGTGQLKPSKFVITPDILEAGEDLLFRIRIDHYMAGNGTDIAVPHPADPYDSTNGTGYNEFQCQLNKISGPTGGFNIVMRNGNYPISTYIDPAGDNLSDQLGFAASDIRDTLESFKQYSKQYDNTLATVGDRTTTQQRARLVSIANNVSAAEVIYYNAVRSFISIQEALNYNISQTAVASPLASVSNTYEMLYLVDIKSARPYDEYWIDTRCATYVNDINKNRTYWQIVPISKIKNAF